MGKFLEEVEIEQLTYSTLLKELEQWKSELGTDYEDEVIFNTIETFEDMLINA